MISGPGGTAESFWIGGAMSGGFFRPFGTRFPLARMPSVQTLGYFRASLRDWKTVKTKRRRPEEWEFGANDQ